ncbi:MAG: histone deacetylase [Candidatus Dormibacteraeota bacterium]|nr:histone deacetylase [Candidatus Dormibacteraeota bacterium]
MARVAVVEDASARHAAHVAPRHPERPDRIEAIRAHLTTTAGLRELPRLAAEPVDDGDLLRVHDAQHIARVAALCAAGGGHFDADTYAMAASDVAARVSAGGAVRAVEAVVGGEFDATFAVVRPPGHHATASSAMGFCLYNNVAVAVQHARQVRGVGRVAIVDIDVHHGNGSEATFWNDPDVLYTSLHQYPFYPGTGAAGDRGGAHAKGLTVNVPLPSGTSAEAWLRAFDDAVLPALQAFEPELLVVSCGFDAHRDDPLAELLLDTQTYAAVADRLASLSAPAGGRTAWVLEGGYDLDALAGSTQAVLEVLVRA